MDVTWQGCNLVDLTTCIDRLSSFFHRSTFHQHHNAIIFISPDLIPLTLLINYILLRDWFVASFHLLRVQHFENQGFWVGGARLHLGTAGEQSQEFIQGSRITLIKMSYRVGKWYYALFICTWFFSNAKDAFSATTDHAFCGTYHISHVFTDFFAETALSKRAGCQATECKKNGVKIDKDDLRLGIVSIIYL